MSRFGVAVMSKVGVAVTSVGAAVESRVGTVAVATFLCAVTVIIGL